MWASQVVLVVKNLPSNAEDIRDVGSIPGSGTSPGGEHGNPLQYSCIENPMDRGAWRAMVQRVAKSQTQLKQLKTHAHTHTYTYTHTRVSYTHMYCTHIMDSTDSLPFEPPGKPATCICTICIYE